MKKIQQLGIFLLFAFSTLQAAPAFHSIDGGYFDVYLKNNCSKTVEVTVRADGSSSVSKYNANDKTKVPVKAGYEVYVDGKLLLKFSDSDSGKEISLCK
ncbi:hypothetical protein FNO01nite_28800 [Flavobacterium noncentrifugens]|uniref:Lysozyme inhibitor n=1 Tax=Flavobacterium noncentrifugens TaxID=1128970 RepID=A0A1G8XW06_9FLAO|nr:hypothetical protein [Flavobacterium noncentrifugens]GEP52208.1 hypothetical protein FNO01nite_28800 [Flavobacterium noncentrifugens]SDJ94691.1 hypothetical protein SAMN04487935_2086 [Flavobacterium noncentrifugens]